MTALRTSAALLLFALALPVAPVCSAQAPVLRQLRGTAAAALLRRVDVRTLPHGVELDASQQQIFTLRLPHAEPLGLVASYFHYEPTPPDPGPPSQCGLFLVPPGGSSQYVSTIGPAFQHGSNLCAGVRAVGLADTASAHPRLITIFSGTGMHGDAYPLPFVFAWDTARHTYTLDEATSQRLQQGKAFAGTVAAVRRLLLRATPAS